MDDNWQPKKMDVEVDVPLTLDLESLRSNGMQVRCCCSLFVIVEEWCIVVPCCVGMIQWCGVSLGGKGN